MGYCGQCGRVVAAARVHAAGCARLGAFVAAMLAGCMPSVSAMVRARWTAIHRGRPQLQTAYSLETVFDEVTFIIGPPLSVGLSVAVWPQAGVLAAALLLVVGVAALVLQRGTEPPLQQHEGAIPSGSLLRHTEIRLLALLMLAMGVIVGTVDITSVAFAEQRGAAACRQRGAVGLCAGQLRGGPAVRGTEAAGTVAAPVAGRRSGHRTDHPAAAVGRQPARAGRGGAAGRGVLRADDDRGDVAGRTTRARIAPDRGHDLAAGRIEHRRGAGRGAVRAERRCGGVRSGFVVALVAGGGVLLLAVLARRALRPAAASTPEGIIP